MPLESLSTASNSAQTNVDNCMRLDLNDPLLFAAARKLSRVWYDSRLSFAPRICKLR